MEPAASSGLSEWVADHARGLGYSAMGLGGVAVIFLFVSTALYNGADCSYYAGYSPNCSTPNALFVFALVVAGSAAVAASGWLLGLYATGKK